MEKKKDQEIMAFLQSKKADQCFHKESTFLSHLMSVAQILRTWKAPEVLVRAGALHSAYGNSWVNLTICCDREEVKTLIGEEAEDLVHQFCTIDRMRFMFQSVLPKLEKVLVVPFEVETKGTRMSKRRVGELILLTLADWIQQWSHFQDDLFQIDGNQDLASFFTRELEKKKEKKENVQAIWPQTHQPGLFLHVLSRLNQVLVKCEEKDLVCPLFPDGGILSLQDETTARDLYCEARRTACQTTILKAIQHNPYVPELYNVAAQICMGQRNFVEALSYATKALRMFESWGTSWDKSVSFEIWVIHTQLLIQQASKQQWPTTAMGIISLGLVS